MLPTPVTDRGDASGTGYFGTSSGGWLHDVVVAALGHDAYLPRVAHPAEVVGGTASGALLAAGTGDNMAAALGLGLQPGEVAVSIGTSGTVFAVSDEPAVDPAGAVAGFADATGRFLPLACTANAGLVLAATAHYDRNGSSRAWPSVPYRRARRGRHHAGALLRRRADARPTRRYWRHVGSDHVERHPAEPRAGRGGRRAWIPRRCGRPASSVRRRLPPGDADWRRRPIARRSASLRRASSVVMSTCRNQPSM